MIAVIAGVVLFAAVVYPLFFADKLYSLAPLQESFAPKEETKFSKQYFTLIQSHDLETAKKYLDPKIIDAQFQEKFTQLVNLVPNETPKSVKFIGAHSVTSNGVTNTNLTSEYEFTNKWLLANLVLQKQGNTFLVQGVHIQPLNDSLENLTQFHFWGQDTKHYIVFTSALLLLAFDIYALVLCIKTPMPKRKWLWIIFILFGFCAVTFDWSTGGIYFNPLNIRMPTVQFAQMLYQPFIINMLIPVGAVVFLLKRKNWLA